jgi:serine/threonine-protein kinase RsbW
MGESVSDALPVPEIRETVVFDGDVPSDLKQGEVFQERIHAALEAAGCDPGEIFGIKYPFEEAIVNAIKHGNQQDPDKTVHVRITIVGNEFHASITDQGDGFDPGELPDPTDPEFIERPCGRGVYTIREMMHRAEYPPEHGGRRLILMKRFTVTQITEVLMPETAGTAE